MCVEFLHYKVCNHERRHFLEKCKFVRNAGCFEPLCAYFFGASGSNLCQFPKVPGEVQVVEGWCTPWCQDRYEVLDPRKFKGRTPSVYMRERVTEITMASGLQPGSKHRRNQRMTAKTTGETQGAGTEQEGGNPAAAPLEEENYTLPAPSIALYHPRYKVYRETDEEIMEPQGSALEWPFREHPSRERMAPALDIGLRPNHNDAPQKQTTNADRLERDHRSKRAFVKLEEGSSDRAPAGLSLREDPWKSVRDRSWAGSEPGYSERSSTAVPPLSEMYRRIQGIEESDTEERAKKSKKNKKKNGKGKGSKFLRRT